MERFPLKQKADGWHVYLVDANHPEPGQHVAHLGRVKTGRAWAIRDQIHEVFCLGVVQGRREAEAITSATDVAESVFGNLVRLPDDDAA